jgi:hypothetical protein
MAEIVQIRSKRGRRKPLPEVSLAIKNDICKDADLRNLVETWIVPKLIEDWLKRDAANTDAPPNEDNGEQS